MSGTDKSKAGLSLDGPIVILVEPQLGENIGMAARAMGNFALSRLRIVNPRERLAEHRRPARRGRGRLYSGQGRIVRHGR
ncbi:tRNA C32,U32 (ribose-2'-O)-methylase TrmJ [Bradyrhizobium sp. F1.13.1]